MIFLTDHRPDNYGIGIGTGCQVETTLFWVLWYSSSEACENCIDVCNDFPCRIVWKCFEDLLFQKKNEKKNKNSQLLNSAFRTITRRSTRSKYFLLTDNHRRTRTDHINNRELNKGVCKEFSSLFYIPENIINNYFIIFQSSLLSRKIFRRPIRWLLYTILFTFYNIIEKKYDLYIYIYIYIYIYPDCYNMQLYDFTLITALYLHYWYYIR